MNTRKIVIAVLILLSTLLQACNQAITPKVQDDNKGIPAKTLEIMEANCSQVVSHYDVGVIEITGENVSVLHELGKITQEVKIPIEAGEHFIGITVGENVITTSPGVEAKDVSKAVIADVESACVQTFWVHYVLLKDGVLTFTPK